MQFKIIAAVLISFWGFSRAEVISVPAGDPSILLDQYFLQAVDTPPGCEGTYFTQIPNSYAIFNFTGIEVTVLGSTNSRGGVYDVYLDSKIQLTIDRYSTQNKPRCGVAMFTRSGLPYMRHSLRMVFKGNSSETRPDSTPAYMDFAAIEYTIPDTDSQDGGSAGKGKIPLAAVIGGAVGGGVLLVLIVAFIWWIVSRKGRDNTAPVTPAVPQRPVRKLKRPLSAAPSSRLDSASQTYRPTSPTSTYRPTSLPPDLYGSAFSPVYNMPPAVTNPARNSIAYPPEINAFDPRFHSHTSSPSADSQSMRTGYMPNQLGALYPHHSGQRESFDQSTLARSATTRTLSSPPAYE